VRSRPGLLLAFHREGRHEEIGVADSESDRFGLAKDEGFAFSQDLDLACRKNNQLARS
jgi:hypothetical protein